MKLLALILIGYCGIINARNKSKETLCDLDKPCSKNLECIPVGLGKNICNPIHPGIKQNELCFKDNHCEEGTRCYSVHENDVIKKCLTEENIIKANLHKKCVLTSDCNQGYECRPLSVEKNVCRPIDKPIEKNEICFETNHCVEGTQCFSAYDSVIRHCLDQEEIQKRIARKEDVDKRNLANIEVPCGNNRSCDLGMECRPIKLGKELCKPITPEIENNGICYINNHCVHGTICYDAYDGEIRHCLTAEAIISKYLRKEHVDRANIKAAKVSRIQSMLTRLTKPLWKP